MSDLILPDSCRTVPDWFKQMLLDTDRNLIVYFNPFKGRWIVDRCTRTDMHDSHSITCPKTNVLVLEGENGDYYPLCEGAIDRIRSMDQWKEHGSYEAFHRERINREIADLAQREAAIKTSYKEAGLDNKRQLNDAFTLIQRHDTARVNQ